MMILRIQHPGEGKECSPVISATWELRPDFRQRSWITYWKPPALHHPHKSWVCTCVLVPCVADRQVNSESSLASPADPNGELKFQWENWSQEDKAKSDGGKHLMPSRYGLHVCIWTCTHIQTGVHICTQVCTHAFITYITHTYLPKNNKI